MHSQASINSRVAVTRTRILSRLRISNATLWLVSEASFKVRTLCAGVSCITRSLNSARELVWLTSVPAIPRRSEDSLVEVNEEKSQ